MFIDLTPMMIDPPEGLPATDSAGRTLVGQRPDGRLDYLNLDRINAVLNPKGPLTIESVVTALRQVAKQPNNFIEGVQEDTINIPTGVHVEGVVALAEQHINRCEDARLASLISKIVTVALYSDQLPDIYPVILQREALRLGDGAIALADFQEDLHRLKDSL